MAVALPAGWIDTGITATHTLDVDAELRAQVPAGFVDFDGLYQYGTAYLKTRGSGAALGCVGLGLGIDSYATVEVVLAGFWSGIYTETVMTSGLGSCTPAFLSAVKLVRTVGLYAWALPSIRDSASPRPRDSTMSGSWMTLPR